MSAVDNGFGMPKTKDEFVERGTFAGWDFDTVRMISESLYSRYFGQAQMN